MWSTVWVLAVAACVAAAAFIIFGTSAYWLMKLLAVGVIALLAGNAVMALAYTMRGSRRS